MSKAVAIPKFLNEGCRVFNLRRIPPPSFSEANASAGELEGTRDFLTGYRTPDHAGLDDPLAFLKARLGSRGPFHPSRFGDGSYPVMYMGESGETCLAEVGYHLTKFLGETSAPITTLLHYQLSLYTLAGETVDVRKGFPALHQEDWGPAQVFGRERQAEHALGITFNSVRRPGGENTAVFKAPLVTLGMKVEKVTLGWDGRSLQQL